MLSIIKNIRSRRLPLNNKSECDKKFSENKFEKKNWKPSNPPPRNRDLPQLMHNMGHIYCIASELIFPLRQIARITA